jgi:uncharacterized protein
MSFLKAEWRKLAFANYEVPPQVLAPYLPFGTELDFWEDRCYVSLVGFMFMDTRLLGIPVPYHINFEEVNLRFYVRRLEKGGWKRGVVFIKEIVPRRALALVANILYGEKYEARKMVHYWELNDADLSVSYQWQLGREWQSFRVTAVKELTDIVAGSEEEFITEHYWGYARASNTRTTEYEVRHPKWQKYDVLDFRIRVDFEKLYGKEFRFLNSQPPRSVMLAEGSGVTVESGRRLAAPYLL